MPENAGSSATSWLKLALLPVLGLCSTAGLLWLAWYPGQLKDSWLNETPSCSFMLTSSRWTKGKYPQVDAALCFLVPFYRSLATIKTGRGAGSLVLSATIPLLLRQSYLSASPNTRSPFLGPFAVLIVHSLARFVGLGVVYSTLGLVFLTLGSWGQMQSSGPETMPVVPVPAGAVYWSNLATVITAALAGLQAIFSPDGSNWTTTVSYHITFPLTLLPVLLFLASYASIAPPKDVVEARNELVKYNAEQVSYSFERTWSYFRKAALASAGLYWYGLSRVILGLYVHNEKLTPPATYMLVNSALLGVGLTLSIVIERLTVRSLAPIHPLTGRPRPHLAVEAHRAISLAPAGNPSLERGLVAPIILGILAGPGAAASLWWSGGEEEGGWYGRRAWRETTATMAAKKAT